MSKCVFVSVCVYLRVRVRSCVRSNLCHLLRLKCGIQLLIVVVVDVIASILLKVEVLFSVAFVYLFVLGQNIWRTTGIFGLVTDKNRLDFAIDPAPNNDSGLFFLFFLLLHFWERSGWFVVFSFVRAVAFVPKESSPVNRWEDSLALMEVCALWVLFFLLLLLLSIA